MMYQSSDPVDFLVIGAGAAGGVMAKELSLAGFRVVVLEQGPWRKASAFRHDEVSVGYRSGLTNNHHLQPHTVRAAPGDRAQVRPAAAYGRVVGGRSGHFA